MLNISIQYFGGRGGSGSSGSRGNRTSGIKNTVGASQKAVDIVEQAQADIQKYGVAQIIINSKNNTSVNGVAKATGGVADKAFEKQITQLANDNGMVVNFKTKSSSSMGVRRKLKYGYQQSNTKSSDRVAYFYGR